MNDHCADELHVGSAPPRAGLPTRLGQAPIHSWSLETALLRLWSLTRYRGWDTFLNTTSLFHVSNEGHHTYSSSYNRDWMRQCASTIQFNTQNKASRIHSVHLWYNHLEYTVIKVNSHSFILLNHPVQKTTRVLRSWISPQFSPEQNYSKHFWKSIKQ